MRRIWSHQQYRIRTLSKRQRAGTTSIMHIRVGVSLALAASSFIHSFRKLKYKSNDYKHRRSVGKNSEGPNSGTVRNLVREHSTKLFYKKIKKFNIKFE